MALNDIVNKQGPLAETFLLFDPATIQHSDEIINNRRADERLLHKRFWTADGAVYTVENNEAVLYFTRREFNPILKEENITDAVGQLLTKHNYCVKYDDFKAILEEAAKKSDNVLKINLLGLGLRGSSSEWCFFGINTSNGKISNGTQGIFVPRVYGYGDNFKENMRMFKDNGITKTKIYALNPEYVKRNVTEGSAIARLCGLDYFDYFSYFLAFERGVLIPDYWLRGALKPNKSIS